MRTLIVLCCLAAVATSARGPPVVFTHVPKCGGTTVHTELDYQARQTRSAYHQALARNVTPAGHWVHKGSKAGAPWVHVPYRDLAPHVRNHATLVTVLRDPVERLRSAYRFSRTKAISEITPTLRAHTLDHLVRNWRLFPQLAMQLWQPQLVLFFSNDTLPQRRVLHKLASVSAVPYDDACVAQCAAVRAECSPLNASAWVQEQCCVCAWEAMREQVVAEAAHGGRLTAEEVDDTALALAQLRLGLLDKARGHNGVEKLEQHTVYARGRHTSALETLQRAYAVVGSLEQLEETWDALDAEVGWFGAGRVHRVHKNASPSTDASDRLSLHAERIVREQLVAGDLWVWHRVRGE